MPDELSSFRLHSAFYDAAIAMALVSTEGHWLAVNPALSALLGYSEQELLATTFQALTHPDDLQADLALLESTLRGERDSYQIEKRYFHKQGQIVQGILSVAATRGSNGSVQHFISQVQDVSDLKIVENSLRQQTIFHSELINLIETALNSDIGQAFYQHMLDVAINSIPGAQVGTMLLRQDDNTFRFVASVGYDISTLQSTYLLESELFIEGNDPLPHVVTSFKNNRAPVERLEPILNAGPTNRIQSILAIPVYLAGSPLAYIYLDNLEDKQAFDSNAVQMARLFGQQIASVWQRLKLETDLREQRRAFEYLALHDTLTGLPNRELLRDRLQQVFTHAQRSDRTFAVVFVDLDDFKHVNDTYGHKVGDLLLDKVAQRLVKTVRTGDTVARWGGDEFVLLLNNLHDKQDVTLVAEKLIQRFSQPFDLYDVSHQTTLSLGIAYYPEHGDSVETLMQHADEALYKAKSLGKNTFNLYNT